VDHDPDGSVDEVFFGRKLPGQDAADREPEPAIPEPDQHRGPDRPRRGWVIGLWPILVGLVVAGLATAVVALAAARPGRGPAAGSGLARVLTGNLVGFRLGHHADADLKVQYLRTPAGKPSVSIAFAAAGLPRGIDYVVTAGDCRAHTARVLASASGLPDDVSGLLLLTLSDMPGSERSVVWVRVANAFGVQFGAVRSPFIVPGSGTLIVPGAPVCPLPGPVSRRHAFRHAHPPGVQDEFRHLCLVNGTQSDEHPVVPEVRITGHQELAWLRSDQRLALFFREAESHDRLVPGERHEHNAANPELHPVPDQHFAGAREPARDGAHIVDRDHVGSVHPGCDIPT
jgi:hypothetical protein